MAAAIKDNFNITSSLEEGHGGIFEVVIDGQVIFNNGNKCSRLPANEEIVQIINERISVPIQKSTDEGEVTICECLKRYHKGSA